MDFQAKSAFGFTFGPVSMSLWLGVGVICATSTVRPFS
jgi:hypothetical protein